MPNIGKIETRAVASLRDYENNARTHSPEQIDQIASSITEYGFTNPVLITADEMIVAGHGRVAAARQLGMSEVPVLVVGADWSPAQLRAYVLADNAIALNAGWDEDLLRLELGELDQSGFDLSLAGFDAKTLEGLLGEPADN